MNHLDILGKMYNFAISECLKQKIFNYPRTIT